LAKLNPNKKQLQITISQQTSMQTTYHAAFLCPDKTLCQYIFNCRNMQITTLWWRRCRSMEKSSSSVAVFICGTGLLACSLWCWNAAHTPHNLLRSYTVHKIFQMCQVCWD